MLLKSLKKRENELANAKRQLELLSKGVFETGELPKFTAQLETLKQFPLKPKRIVIASVGGEGASGSKFVTTVESVSITVMDPVLGPWATVLVWFESW